MELEVVECPICKGVGITENPKWTRAERCGACGGEGKLVFPKQSNEAEFMLKPNGHKVYILPGEDGEPRNLIDSDVIGEIIKPAP